MNEEAQKLRNELQTVIGDLYKGQTGVGMVKRILREFRDLDQIIESATIAANRIKWLQDEEATHQTRLDFIQASIVSADAEFAIKAVGRAKELANVEARIDEYKQILADYANQIHIEREARK
jgi:chaperonin cofactor prefoldin